MSCSNINPCRTTLTNTAAYESLPSQISNFTLQFFGEVIKTEIDGVVSWSLPCELDTGLPNNPRAAGEGLACYFLRLFQDGIVGLTGPEGPPGADGCDGKNAYTVSLQSFIQPTIAAPFIQILTAYNPAIRDGMYVFIDGSGWYLVNAVDLSGTLFLQLAKGLDGVTGTIAAGKLVVPSGFPGENGTNGATGATGPQGEPGTNTLATNGFFSTDTGTDYNLQTAFAKVDFSGSIPVANLPAAGTYLLTAVVDLVGLTGVALTDNVDLKLFNLTTGGDVSGGEHSISYLADGQRASVTLHAILTIAEADQIVIYGRCNTAGKVAVVARRTVLSYVRMS